MVSKRETPQRRQMASKAGQAPAKLAVCEAAARAPASLPPDLTMHTPFFSPSPAPAQPGVRGAGAPPPPFVAPGLDDPPGLGARCGPGQQRRKAWGVFDRFHV